MPIYNTEELGSDGKLGTKILSPFETLQVYNTLDCCLTFELDEEIKQTHESSEEIWSPIYSFERALQAPYLSIMRKGFRVNEQGRQAAARELRARIDGLQSTLNELAQSVWSRGLNPNSPKQLIEFLYGSQGLRLPEQWLSFKGVKRLSTGREALEKLDQYLYAKPFVNIILAIRDLKKQLEIFESAIDPDGRFRAAYNIAGTETGRPSSSENAFGTGRNAQNIAPGLRWPFEADEGYRLCVIDLEQVEARDVGYFIGCLFGDWDFLNSCESGDLHTNNAKRIWPTLGWTGDRKEDREIADRNFYREFSFRDMAKRGSHLSNYMGTAWTAARSLKVPLGIMEEFQARYCRGGPGIEPAFPGIVRWWQWTATELQTKRELRTPLGRRRHFFGRPSDDATLREAIAFLPQSTTADRMNLGLWRVWRYEPRVQLLAQTYDSITFQYKESEDEKSIISNILQLIQIELKGPGPEFRSYVVPGEAKVGWNWGVRVSQDDRNRAEKEKKKIPRLNPDGLIKWSASRPDSRFRSPPSSVLQASLHDF